VVQNSLDTRRLDTLLLGSKDFCATLYFNFQIAACFNADINISVQCPVARGKVDLRHCMKNGRGPHHASGQNSKLPPAIHGHGALNELAVGHIAVKA